MSIKVGPGETMTVEMGELGRIDVAVTVSPNACDSTAGLPNLVPA